MNQGTRSHKQKLVDILTELVVEIHPHKKGSVRVELDSLLAEDLGFDSLGRVEMVARIEKEFEILLPEHLLAVMEKPKDLLEAIESASPTLRFNDPPPVPNQQTQGPLPLPIEAKTLTEVLDYHAHFHGPRTHLIYYDEEDRAEEVSFLDLKENAEIIAANLCQAGLDSGETAAIMLPTGKDYFYCFFGILLAGAVPVPIYPPARLSQVEDHMRRHATILENAQTRILITLPEAKKLCYFLKGQVQPLKKIATMKELRKEKTPLKRRPVSENDLALLQYTSGSTGNPKGVELTHKNLLANIRIMSRTIGVTSQDNFVSWLPLYHDMGLIGAWLGSLYNACTFIVMSPLSFLLRPERWLWAIHRHKGTLSAGPNFAYELCNHKIDDHKMVGLDLSSWRVAFNGAEPVSLETLRSFERKFRAFGFDPSAIKPVYGLAEASLGLTFPAMNRPYVYDTIDKEKFLHEGEAVPLKEGTDKGLELVCCGKILPEYELRVVDDLGEELPERTEGILQFKGPSVTKGYHRNPEATAKLFDGDWAVSGDLAYIAEGGIYITGRVKDVIIRAGRNIYPHQLEEEVGNLEGVRKGCVAVVGIGDKAKGTEGLVVVAEIRLKDSEEKQDLQDQIDKKVMEMLGIAADEILLVPPQTVLKTSSGKIRRSAMKELYDQRNLTDNQGRPSLTRQIAKLYWAGTMGKTKSWFRFWFSQVYSFYGWSVTLCIAAWLLPLMVLTPGKKLKRTLVKLSVKTLFLFLGLSPKVTDSEHLKGKEAKIVVSNHASYLDALVMACVLPTEIDFVAKGELRKNWIFRLLAHNLGVVYVERFEFKQGAKDADKLSELIRKGGSILVFAEGTFVRRSGLLPFKMGAFKVAAETGVKVVPLTLKGSRYVLPDESLKIRKGKLKISVHPPLLPDGADFAASLKLRDQVRAIILDKLGEPDYG